MIFNKKGTENIRRQLTLFLTDNFDTIENVRQKYNPAQFELIKAHVTLCREDEIENLEQVLQNLSDLKALEISIQFEGPLRFDDGKGVYLKSCSNSGEFDNLRHQVLKNVIDNPRQQLPHITLMHPRNSTCYDEIFELISREEFPSNISFKTISLIEQRNNGKWEVIERFSLIKDK